MDTVLGTLCIPVTDAAVSAMLLLGVAELVGLTALISWGVYSLVRKYRTHAVVTRRIMEIAHA